MENCLNYIADLCWALATNQRFNKDALKPYTQLINEAEKKTAPPNAEKDDFYAILKDRVNKRKKGGETA